MSQSLAEAIAAEVRAEMARKGLKHRELAAHLGIVQSQVSQRLRGLIEFRPTELEKTAELLGVPVTNFLPQPATSAT